MPLTARDVLFVLRAQDFASREVTKLAGSFGMLGKQMEAVNRSNAIRMGEFNDQISRVRRDGARHMASLTESMRVARKEGVEKLANSQVRAASAADRLKRAHIDQVAPMRIANQELLTRDRILRDQIATGQVQGEQLKKARKELRENAMARRLNTEAITRSGVAHEAAEAKRAKAAQSRFRGIRRQTDANVEAIRSEQALAKAGTQADIDRIETQRRLANEAAQADRDRINRQREIGRAYQQSGTRMLFAGAIMTAVGVAGVAGLVAMAKSAANFRQEIALAQTQAEDMGVSIQELQGMAYGVAEAIPAPLSELAGGLYDIFSSIEVGAEDGRKLLRQYAKDAVAGQVAVEDASRANIGILNAWGKSAEDVTDVSDTLFRLVERGVGSYDEFTGSIGRAVPATVRIGEEFETLAGIMAFLTRRNLSTEQSATAAARSMELIADPRVVTRLEEIGFTMRDAEGNFVDFISIIDQMNQRWGDLPAPERAEKMMEIFGGAGYRIQARRFLDLAIPGFEDLNYEIGKILDKEGAANRAYTTMFEQPVSQMQLLGNNAKILANEFGENLFDSIDRIVSVGMGMLNWFRNLNPATKSVITSFMEFASIGLIVGGVMTMMLGVGKLLFGTLVSLRAVAGLTTILASVNTAILGTAAASTTATSAAGALWSALMGPAGILAAIVAITGIALFTWAKRSSEELVTASESAETLAKFAGGAYISVEDMGSALEDGADSAITFALANQKVISELRTLSDEAARARIEEIGFNLIQRSDLEPEEIQAQMDQLVEAAGLNILIPIKVDDLNLQDSVASQTTRIIDQFEGMWADLNWNSPLNVGINSTKALVTDLAETIGSALKAGDIEGAVTSWAHFEEQVRKSGATADTAQMAMNFLADEVARVIEFAKQGDSEFDTLASTIERLAEEGVIGGKNLLELDRAMGVTRNSAEYLALGIDVFSSAAQGMPPIVDAAGNALDGYGDDQEDMRTEVEKATDALNEQQDAFRAIVDPLFAARQAESALAEAQTELTEVMADGESSLEDRLSAQQALIDAGYDLEHANRVLIAAEADGIDTFETMRASIDMLSERYGINAESIRPVIEAMEETRGRALDIAELESVFLTLVTNFDTELAMLNELGRVIRNLDGEVIGIRVERTGGAGTITAGTGAVSPWRQNVPQQHAGGWAGSGPLRDLFDIGPKEIPSILHQGEFVLSEDMVKRLRSMPKFQSGGGFGPFTGGGVKARSVFDDVTRQGSISGWEPTEELRAIDAAIAKVNSLEASWEAAAEAAQQASERAKLVEDINAAEDAEERAAATQALREWDVERAVAAEKAAIERALEQAEIQRQLAANRDQYHYDNMTTNAKLVNVKKRLAAEQSYTDEWMSLMSERQQLEQQLADERQRLIDNKATWRFEHMTTQQQLAEIQKRIRNEKKYTDEWLALARQREQLRKEMADARQRLIDNKAEWKFEHMTTEQQLAELNRRIKGVKKYSDEWMQLARQREQLQKELVDESRKERESAFESELQNLNNMLDEYAAAQQSAADAVTSAVEQRRSALESEMGLLGEGVMNTSDYAALARAQNEQMGEWHEGLLELQERGVSREVIDALGLTDSPEQLANVRRMLSSTDAELADLNAAMIERQAMLNDIIAEESENAFFELAQSIKDIHTELESELDAIGKDEGRTWAEAISEGIATGLPAIRAQVKEVQKLMRDLKASGVSISPTGEIEATSYDSGGVLKPGYTLAYNGTGANEYVVKNRHGSGSTVVFEEGAFQFNGPIDSATLPEVERLIQELKDDLADELRSN